jgi:hypothetical protein
VKNFFFTVLGQDLLPGTPTGYAGKAKGKPRLGGEPRGVLRCKCLTMTYFHTGICTIIGAESFHGPVRDGKGWYRLAMVVRLKRGADLVCGQDSEFTESNCISVYFDCVIMVS